MSKISNPAGAVRVLRSTMAKMVEEFKVQERRMKRLEAEVERKSKALTLAGADYREATWAAGHLAAAVKVAIHALTGSHIPTDDARELGANLLDFVRGTMRVIEQNNVEGAEQRERIREMETAESARLLTLAEDNAIVNALTESRLGDMSPVEAVVKALRAEAVEPIYVSRSSTRDPIWSTAGPFLRGEYRLMREYRPSEIGA